MIKIKFKDGTEEDFQRASEFEVDENYLYLNDENDDLIAVVNFNEVKFAKKEK